VEEGAYINLQVKYGLIRLVNTKADLCEQIKNVDLECPLKKGKAILTKTVDLPKEIPPVLMPQYRVLGIKSRCLNGSNEMIMIRASTPSSPMSTIRTISGLPA
jgi:hypothetical protein